MFKQVLLAFSTLTLAWTAADAHAAVYDSDCDGVADWLDVCCDTPAGVPVDSNGRPLSDADGDCDVDLEDFALLQASMTGPLTFCVPCMENTDCDRSEYCTKIDGQCTEEGLCNPRPLGCPDVWDPVCGCDGQTHSNDCDAAMVGVSVAYAGECHTLRCWSNSDCPEDDYCLFRGCAAETGVCLPRPDACPEVLDPVCGCNGRTYVNACFAAMAGQTVDYDGACMGACDENDECPVEEFCKKANGDCQGQGKCRARPTVCPTLWDPVCGCDGETYANECVAAAGGVSVDYAGECRPPACWSNDDCDSASFCLFHVCAAETGHCQPRPQDCAEIYDPACGCDGQTYANACFAHMAGQSVDYLGVCSSPACVINAGGSSAE